MAVSALVLAAISLVFGLCGFGAGVWACIQVLAWKRSTHKIEYRTPSITEIESDIPAHILDQMPSRPEPQTLEQYTRERHEQSGFLLDDEE